MGKKQKNDEIAKKKKQLQKPSKKIAIKRTRTKSNR
jgi:hypothetical protein